MARVSGGDTRRSLPLSPPVALTTDQRLAFVSVGSDDSIDDDLREPSPSTGAEQVAKANHAVYGLGDPEPEATVESDDYLKDFYGVSS